MRDLLRLPALFVLFLVLLLLLLTGIDLLSTWGTGLSAGRDQALALAGARLLPALQESLPISVLLALVLLLLRSTLRPGSRFLTFVVPLAAAFVVLAFGYQALGGLASRLESRQTASVEERHSTERYLAEGRFTQAGEQVLFLSELSGRTMQQVVLYDPQARPPRLRFFPRGLVAVAPTGVRVSLSGTIRELPTHPVYGPLFAEDPAVRPLLVDVSVLNQELARLSRESRAAFVLTSLALVFAFYAAGLFFRVTRWPLLNVVIAFLVLRAYLYLYRLIGRDMVDQLSKVFGNPSTLDYLPALVLLVLGVLFLLVDVLFVPRERRRGEHA